MNDYRLIYLTLHRAVLPSVLLMCVRDPLRISRQQKRHTAFLVTSQII